MKLFDDSSLSAGVANSATETVFLNSILKQFYVYIFGYIIYFMLKFDKIRLILPKRVVFIGDACDQWAGMVK